MPSSAKGPARRGPSPEPDVHPTVHGRPAGGDRMLPRAKAVVGAMPEDSLRRHAECLRRPDHRVRRQDDRLRRSAYVCCFFHRSAPTGDVLMKRCLHRGLHAGYLSGKFSSYRCHRVEVIATFWRKTCFCGMRFPLIRCRNAVRYLLQMYR